jgi:D-alanine-D-alanine ligase
MSGGKTSKTGGASKGMASVSRKIPAPISDDMTKKVQELAVRAFQCLGCNGVVRFDFMIDRADGSLYLNEINTIPGSLSFYLWEPTGMPYGKMLDRLVDLAVKRRRDEERVIFSFETNILNQSSLKGLKGSKGSKS